MPEIFLISQKLSGLNLKVDMEEGGENLWIKIE